jgi:hypothetical protein
VPFPSPSSNAITGDLQLRVTGLTPFAVCWPKAMSARNIDPMAIQALAAGRAAGPIGSGYRAHRLAIVRRTMDRRSKSGRVASEFWRHAHWRGRRHVLRSAHGSALGDVGDVVDRRCHRAGRRASGNWFNQELFGRPSTPPRAVQRSGASTGEIRGSHELPN